MNMRIAVSGSHSTGKSTLIAAFLDKCPEYRHEPEAFETLGDDVELTEAGEPTPEGLQALLEYTAAGVRGHAPGSCVVFERSPVDYLAYAAASRTSRWRSQINDFLSVHVPVVRAALEHLDLIAYVPVSATGPVRARPGENARFRSRVDERLRRALLDDAYDLFGDRGAPRVVALPPDPERQLAELIQRAGVDR
jgi:AAA domain-containing protein